MPSSPVLSLNKCEYVNVCIIETVNVVNIFDWKISNFHSKFLSGKLP